MLPPDAMLAYLGPAPGMEFIPYFFALLAWLGAAFAVVLFSPLAALIRRFRGKKTEPMPDDEMNRTEGR